MKAAVTLQSGAPQVIEIQERSIPEIKEGWVLIKIKAFGLNRSELFTRQGHSPDVVFPRIQGIECVGTVEEEPSGTYQEGQKVAAIMGGMGRDFDGDMLNIPWYLCRLYFLLRAIYRGVRLEPFPKCFKPCQDL